MLKIVLGIFLLVNASFACKMEWKYGETSSGCMMIDGKKRDFRYFIPEHAKGVILPLVIGLHGGGGTPKRFENYTHFTSPIRRYSDLIVHRLLLILFEDSS